MPVLFLVIVFFASSSSFGLEVSRSNQQATGLDIPNRHHLSQRFIFTKNKSLLNKINRYFKNSKKKVSQKNLQEYLIKHSYYQFQIETKKDSFTIKNPVQTIFVIKGNQFLKDYVFRNITDANTYNLGIEFYDAIEANIITAYKKQGFQKVQVDRSIKTKGWKQWSYFKITEGPRIRIGKITINGLFSKPAAEYKKLFLNSSTSLIKRGFYNEKDLELGYKNLSNYLNAQGFLEAKIYPDPVNIKSNIATINLSINEGPLTIIKDITFKGISSIPISEILSVMKSKIQSPLNFILLEQDLKNIEVFYFSKGYLSAKIMNKEKIIRHEQDNKEYANLVIEVREGQISHISSIHIEGLLKVKKKVVVKLLDFKVGEVLTPKKINKTKENLGALGLFSQISIAYKQQKTRTKVLIKLKERKPRSIRGGVGFNSERGLTTRTYMEFSYNNLFGWGRSLFFNTSGQISLVQLSPSLEYEISARYKEVFSIGERYEGNINLSRSKDIFSYSAQNTNVVYKDQLSLFMNKTINKNISLVWNLFNFEKRTEGCIIDNNCPKNLQKIGSSSFYTKWDSRDNLFNPKKGSLFSFSGEWASPFLGSSADIYFWKFHFQNQLYYSFLDVYTLALAFRLGVIQAEKIIPVSRAFILGGQTSIRAYDGNIEGDRIPSMESSPIETANEPLKLKVNGQVEKALQNNYGLAKLEFRFPVSNNFKGLIFYDAGVVYIKGLKSNLVAYGHSVGIGMRYETFLLPIGLDIAYKLPPKTGADYRFHFSIGFF